MKGITLNASSIVAGSAIGAGMLGLPMAVSHLGFTVSFTLLVIFWVISLYSGLLILEVDGQVGPGLHFNKMVKSVLGMPGQIVAVFSLALLLYCLLIAYITGMGSILVETFQLQEFPHAYAYCALSFSAVMIVIVYCGTATIVRFNTGFFLGMLVAMTVTFASIVPAIDVDNLIKTAPAYKHLLPSLPIIFAAYGYHFCIPSTWKITEGNRSIMRKALFFGTVIPFVCYTLWFFLTLGSMTIPQLDMMDGSVEMLIEAIAFRSPLINITLSIFASFALVTSFFGVSLSLYNLAEEVFNLKETHPQRMFTSVIVFAPPLAAAYFAPQSFIDALAYAGVGFSILCITLPSLMSWKLRYQKRHSDEPIPYKVAGGIIPIIITFFIGLLIIFAAFLKH